MIDPKNVTNFKRTSDELLEFWLFCLFVRGKNADVQAKKLDIFIEKVFDTSSEMTLTACLREICYNDFLGKKSIYTLLLDVKSGQYDTLEKAIFQTVDALDTNERFLSEASPSALETIHGVGPKTSRFFLLHTRENARVAALDVHILRYLRDHVGCSVPKSTPTGKKYKELENAFLLMADYEGVSPARMDLAIWKASRETHHTNWRQYL